MDTLDALIRQRLRAAAGPGRRIGRADRGRLLRLSAGQQQMWLLHQFDPASPAYLMTWTLRLSGRLDVESMRLAWERVLARHEILRTRYTLHGEEPVQVVDPPVRFELRVIDLTAEPADRRELRAGQVAEWERGRPADLTRREPVRVSLLVLDPELHLMVVNIHHIACDDVSFRRIATELSALYAEHTARSGPAALPEVDIQYADFAAWELAGRAGGALRSHLDYWRHTLDGVTELALPLDRPRPARPDSRGGTVDIAIGSETAGRVRELAAVHRASPYMLLLAVYHAMLAHLSGSADVAVGMPVSARTRPELDELVGYLVNTVVVRSRQAGGGTFADLLAQVRASVLDAMDHRAAPFKWVVDEVSPARAGAANPLFQVAFDMERTEESPFRFPGLRVEQQFGQTESPAAKFDLTLHVAEEADDRLFARLEFATAVIDDGTARAWAAYWLALLDAVVREPDVPLGQLHQRLGGLRGGGAPVPDAPAVAPAAAGNLLVERIHRIWCDVLGDAGIEVWDNFFDVGGDSLRAVALAGRLKAEGLGISATDIFAYQTIEELAGACGGDQAAEPAPLSVVAPFALIGEADRAALPAGVVDAYPLAAMQLGMIIELKSRPDVNTYQDTTSYLIRDEVGFDAAALQRAVQRVVDRHEVLRTTFDLNSYSVPLQLVHERATITVGVANYGTLGPDGWLPRLQDYAARERAWPMDLACAPLIRVYAHTADDTPEWFITITECHPILEGWSFHSMLMEILTGYQEIRAGRTPAEPEPVGVRYADYIAAEAAARRSDEDRSFWRAVVEGRADALPPAVWRDDPAVARERYQHLVYFRDIEDDLRRLASQTRTSMKAVLLAAHLKVMSMITGRPDFFTGLVCDARPEVAGADRVFGMYLNTVPFAMPSGAATWGELVKAVYDALTELWPHRVFPMQAIQQEFAHRGRLLEVFFNYLDFHQVDEDLVDEDQTLNDNDNEFALHVFTMTGLLKFNTTNHCLSRAAAGRLEALYRTVLEEMSLGPDGDACAASLPPAERALVRPGSEPDPVTVLESFAVAVREHPGAPAVRMGGDSLSYVELNAWAGAIAHRLRQCGAGPGSRVAVAPQRDPGTLAALLAVWMTGAAVVPMEPGADASIAVAAAEATPVEGVDVPVLVAREVRSCPADRPPMMGPRPEDPAWAGSGSALSHRALASAVANAPGAGSSWLCAAPLDSLGALTELLVPLCSGGVAVLTAAALPEAVPEVRELLDAGAVTHLRLTPLVAERLLVGSLPAGVTALVGGDPLAGPAPSGGPGRLISVVEVGGLPGWVALDGEPVPGLGVQVVDTELRPVPAGVAGELCLSGAGLPDGPHRTGQLARFAPDGTLEQLGPLGQRTVRGEQPVELYRTREQLNAHQSTVDSVVLLRKDKLVGYVRTVPDAPFAADDLRRFLAVRRLSRQLIPDVLVPVDTWPVDAHGMIDTGSLPEPPDPAGDGEAPWDDRFEALLRETLAAGRQFTPDAPLTDFGLDSFGTVGLLVALEQTYGITIPDEFQIVDMFRTLRTLWETVAALRDAR